MTLRQLLNDETLHINSNTCLVSTYQVEKVSSGTFSCINSIANQNRVELWKP